MPYRTPALYRPSVYEEGLCTICGLLSTRPLLPPAVVTSAVPSGAQEPSLQSLSLGGQGRAQARWPGPPRMMRFSSFVCSLVFKS
jgi:hypothetical protein